MPPWFPRSTFGVVLAVIYVVIAVFVVIGERGSGGGGGWISLRGMGAFLLTFPVSAPGELLGLKPDYRRNLDMIFAIGTCTVMVYFLGAGLARLARMIFSGEGPP